MDERGMTIGVLAARAGVNVETIRYYHRRGLLPAPARPYGQVRRYDDASLQRVEFVKRAQRLGFTLEEVEALLSLNDGTGCQSARRIAEHKLVDIEARLHDLKVIRATLKELIGRCAVARGRVACPLIGALECGTRGRE